MCARQAVNAAPAPARANSFEVPSRPTPARRRPAALFILLLAALLAAFPAPHGAQAGAGELDPTFGGGDGRVNDNFGTPYGNRANAVVVQPDGKVVIAAEMNISGRGSDFGLARYNPDGSLDPTFGAGGKVLTDIYLGSDIPYALALQTDGKLVAAGTALGETSGVVTPEFAVVRYNPDGSLDTTFGGGDGIVTTDFFANGDTAYAVAVQPDGRIVAAGQAFRPNSTGSEFAVARYNPDGSLDATFGDLDPSTGARTGRVATDILTWNDIGRGLAVQSDGKLVVAGYAQTPSYEYYDFALARYEADGRLDPTFGGDGRVTTRFFEDDFVDDERAYAVRVQPDGKIVAAGFARDRNETVFATQWEDFALARYNADGSLDPTFDGDGLVWTNISVQPGGSDRFNASTQDRAHALLLQPDGKLVAGGFASCCSSDGTEDFALTRYHTDGRLDATFGGDGIVRTDFLGRADTDDEIYGLALQPDGRIVAAGRTETDPFRGTYDYALARYTGGPAPAPTPTPIPTPAPAPVNLALGRASTQSSDLAGGVASRAADGNTSGVWSQNSVTHTNNDAQAWWQVDLGAVQQLNTIKVWNRTDSYSGRLSNFYVLVSDVPFSSAGLAATLSQPGVSSYHTPGQAGSPTTVGVNRTGRYVRVQLAGTNYLTIAEVEVIGTALGNPAPTPTPTPTPTPVPPPAPTPTPTPQTLINLAVGMTASQSSDLVGGVAARAVDGNASGVWSQNSVTHTNNDAQAWWQVDLGAVQTVGAVRVWNRTDAYANRLSNFYVFVSDVPFISTSLTATLSQTGVSSYHTPGTAGSTTTLNVNRTGRYVRVQLAGTNYLSLAEVEVMGTIGAGPQPTPSPAPSPAPSPSPSPTPSPTPSSGPGSLDPSFGRNGKVDISGQTRPKEAWGLALQPDGKILYCGPVYIEGAGNGFGVERRNADGSPDPSFGDGGVARTPISGVYDWCWSVAVAPDGKIVAAGQTHINNAPDVAFAVVRYNADGSLDPTFGGDGIVVTNLSPSLDHAFSVLVQPDGRVVAAGFSTSAATNNPTAYDFAAVRYNVDGTLDTTFDGDGVVITDFFANDNRAWDAVLQPDGRLVLAGIAYHPATGYDFAVARYHADGSLDATFDGDGRVNTPFRAGNVEEMGRSVALAPGGRIVVGGWARDGSYGAPGDRVPTADFAAARYNPDGSLDATFDGDGRFVTNLASCDVVSVGCDNDYGNAVAVQRDGKVVLAGVTNTPNVGPGNHHTDFTILRLNADGSRDSSFGASGVVAIDFVDVLEPPDIATHTGDDARNVIIQPDGRILLSGEVSVSRSRKDVGLARLRGDTPPAFNLALGRTASQSSDLVGGVASRAVDGNTSGAWSQNSVTHTNNDAQAWWQVDLGGGEAIQAVRVWNRTDAYSGRLSNFYVLVSDEPFASTGLTATLAQPGVSAFYVSGTAGTPTTVSVNRTGRHVRIQLAGTNYLTIAEVEIF